MDPERGQTGKASRFLWLIRAAAAPNTDAEVETLLDVPEERVARRVLPPEFFGWLAEEAQAVIELVRGLTDEDKRLPYHDIARATARVLIEVCLRIVSDQPGRPMAEVPFRLAAPAVRHGVDAALVVQSMRIMERRWVTRLLIAAADDVADIASTVLAASAAVYDPIVDSFMAEYVAEQSRLQVESLAHRRALVDDLLKPGPHDPDAFSDLDIDLSLHHVGVVLWFPAAGIATQLESVARELGRQALAQSVLTVPGDDRSLWVWLSFAKITADVERAATQSRSADDRISIAIAPSGQGVQGFRQTHLLARDYGAVARRLPIAIAPRIAHAENCALLSLLLRDRERAEWFVSTELGSLAETNTPSDVENIETLRVYLSTGQSLAQTAKTMQVHRNTVVYRLGRIEQIIGRTVASRRHELYAASLLFHALGRAPEKRIMYSGTNSTGID